MFDYDKQQFLIASKSITFINLEETPDDISRNYKIAIINSINQK